MLQDLERGLKTETPLNAQIVELVHATERRERHPSREVFNELSLIA